ncbi:hypothetical protein TWF694_003508 [Orbilia ellipsospora]|uniref:alpha-galactosidase n=1 Tax=Orbilia ellipsospora TaxID=2528407 RepID=A0AAV9WYE2_9PEZI
MQLIGRRGSLLTLLAASEFTLLGAPGVKAAPAMESSVEERAAAPAENIENTDSNVAARAYSWWVPTQQTTWQIQLSGTVNTNVNAQAIEIDADTPIATVQALKKKGMKVIAYISGGSWEDWRTDAIKFPKSVIGSPLDGWPGESWLDVRNIGVLEPLMKARVLRAKAKGFDGVEWDNVDTYTQDSGFHITYNEQITYNKMLADMSHSLGMTVALKNDLNQIKDLVSHFDYAVNEECGFYKECHLLQPFISAGKAVLGLEYPGEGDDTRTQKQARTYAAKYPAIYTLIKKMDLGAWGIISSSGVSVLKTAGSRKASTKTSRKLRWRKSGLVRGSA